MVKRVQLGYPCKRCTAGPCSSGTSGRHWTCSPKSVCPHESVAMLRKDHHGELRMIDVRPDSRSRLEIKVSAGVILQYVLEQLFKSDASAEDHK